jgi:hypothetical protein
MQIDGQKWKHDGTRQRVEGKCDGQYIQPFPRRFIIYGWYVRLHGLLVFPTLKFQLARSITILLGTDSTKPGDMKSDNVNHEIHETHERRKIIF